MTFTARIREGLVRAPASVMALGIFYLFAARFLLSLAFGERAVEAVLYSFAWALAAWYAFLVALFARQARVNAKSLWDYTPAHFAIGTWAAATNVLARVMISEAYALARALAVCGTVLWAVYMFWLIRMATHTEQRRRLDGTALLTTVATQSVVVCALRVWPELPPAVVYAFLALNLLGAFLYAVHFYLVWVARGVKAQLQDWVAANNITHGAISISVLAGELQATHVPAWKPFMLRAVDAGWFAASLAFAGIAAFELYLAATRASVLLRFRTANWSRNFTYGMYFACTYYAVETFPGCFIARVAGNAFLVVLAVAVALLNAWEVANMLADPFAERSARPAIAPSLIKEVNHG